VPPSPATKAAGHVDARTKERVPRKELSQQGAGFVLKISSWKIFDNVAPNRRSFLKQGYRRRAGDPSAVVFSSVPSSHLAPEKRVAHLTKGTLAFLDISGPQHEILRATLVAIPGRSQAPMTTKSQLSSSSDSRYPSLPLGGSPPLRLTPLPKLDGSGMAQTFTTIGDEISMRVSSMEVSRFPRAQTMCASTNPPSAIKHPTGGQSLRPC